MQVLIVGSSSAPDCADVLRLLRSQLPVDAIRLCLTLDCDDDLTTHPADIVLVLQQWPEQFTRREVLCLIDRYPLARLVVCYSRWCDSDGRTRDAWPHGVRVPMTEATDRLRREIDSLRIGHPPLPLTASRNETFDAQLATSSSRTHSQRLISVVTGDRGIRGHLRSMLEAAGHSVVLEALPTCHLILWDADPWAPHGRKQLAALLPQCVGVPLIALCGFPLQHEVRELMEAGVSAVLSKVTLNETLLEHVESLGQSAPINAQPAANLRAYDAG